MASCRRPSICKKLDCAASLPGTDAATRQIQQVRKQESMKVFDRVVQRQPPPEPAVASPTKEAKQAMDEFNAMKYRQAQDSDAKAAFLV